MWFLLCYSSKCWGRSQVRILNFWDGPILLTQLQPASHPAQLKLIVHSLWSSIASLFDNMRNLTLKTWPTVLFFTATNIIVNVSGNKMFEMSCLRVVIGAFWSILLVSVFRGPMCVITIMIDGSVKCKPYLSFDVPHVWLKGAVKPASINPSFQDKLDFFNIIEALQFWIARAVFYMRK